jgi:hypothetical protein
MKKEVAYKNVCDLTQNKEIEEDNIVIKSEFIKDIVSKLISNAIQKELKYEANLNLDEIDLVVTETNVHIHLDANATIGKKDLMKILDI